MPVTSWLDDATPAVSGTTWRLAVTDAAGTRHLSLDELVAPGTTTVQATLDCTSGWYATSGWTGVPLSRLLSAVDPASRSIRVRSLTGTTGTCRCPTWTTCCWRSPSVARR